MVSFSIYLYFAYQNKNQTMRNSQLIAKSTIILGSILFFFSCEAPPILKKRISEGKIVYNIKYPEQNASSSIAGVLPSEMVIYFKDNNLKSVMKGAMNFYSIEILSPAKSDSTYTFLRVMDKKVFVASPNTNGVFIFEQLKGSDIQLIDGLEKEFLGFKCKKALLTMDDKGIAPIEAYYTNMIRVKNPNKNTPFYKVPGVLVEFELLLKNIRCTITAKEISPLKLDDNTFAITPKYKRISEAEMTSIMVNLMQ